jgi:putative ABC transport system substrate-binding protein
VSRRQFVQGVGVAGLGLLAGCGRLPGQAPPPAQVHRIAYLTNTSPGTNPELMVAFRQGMRDLGYVEGQNLLIDEHHVNGQDHLPESVVALLRGQPDVILVGGVALVRPLLAATSTIPIVNPNPGGTEDLVTSGLAASYARPGGIVTGLSSPDLVAKQFQLLHEVVPTLSVVAVLAPLVTSELRREPYEAASRALGLQLEFMEASGSGELEQAFAGAIRKHADGLLVARGPTIADNQVQIAELALQHRLPSLWRQPEAVARGGLMAYGQPITAGYRRAAYYVDRILKGANPADLPIEQPTTFDFVINLKTAQALGLTIPEHVLLQATEVIQ